MFCVEYEVGSSKKPYFFSSSLLNIKPFCTLTRCFDEERHSTLIHIRSNT